jgi:hypothetical protein
MAMTEHAVVIVGGGAGESVPKRLIYFPKRILLRLRRDGAKVFSANKLYGTLEIIHVIQQTLDAHG